MFVCLLQVLVLGQAGEEVSLELILRVVADVGLVVSLFIWVLCYLLSLCYLFCIINEICC